VTGAFGTAQPTFSDLSAHPTTLSGYGITDALPSSTQLAVTKAAVTSNFLTSYTSTSGAFTAAQPTFSDLSAHPTTLSGYGITDALPIGGGTLTGGLGFTDNTYDIGNVSTLRPRTVYAATSVISPVGTFATSVTTPSVVLTGTNKTTLASGATGSDWTLTTPTTAGAAGQVLKTDGSGNTSWTSRTASFNFVIDGGGSVPGTGVYGQISVPVACTITGWVLTGDASGSAVVDVLACTYANFPTTASICSGGAGDKPTLSTVQNNENLSVSGSVWTTALTAGEQLQVNLNSVTTCKRLNLTILVTIP
jgi:hypothetical protein